MSDQIRNVVAHIGIGCFIFAASLVTGAAAAVCTGVAVVSAAFWLSLPRDPAPEGPRCNLGDESAILEGLERIDWGLFPRRVCVATDFSGSELVGAPEGTSDLLIVALALLPAFVLGCIVLVVVAMRVNKRLDHAFRARYPQFM